MRKGESDPGCVSPLSCGTALAEKVLMTENNRICVVAAFEIPLEKMGVEIEFVSRNNKEI